MVNFDLYNCLFDWKDNTIWYLHETKKLKRKEEWRCDEWMECNFENNNKPTW